MIDISLKNTKAQLFEAYQNLKNKIEGEQKEQLPLAQVKMIKNEENEILEKTASFLPENLEKDVSSLEKKIKFNLADVKNSLVLESEKLEELRKAIAIETKKLEEIYNIKLSANVLQTLIVDFDVKKKELEEQRIADEKSLQEEMLLQRKEWEREQEEYKYNLKIERKKEQDEFDFKLNKQRAEWQEYVDKKELELNERDENLNLRTEEIETMKKEIESFPKKVEQASKEAEQNLKNAMQKDFDIQKKLREGEWSSEKNMLETKIDNLEMIMKNQNIEIISLKKSLSEANQHAQSLATNIIENAPGYKSAENVLPIKKEMEEK